MGAQVVLVGELVGATLDAHLLDLDAYRREGVFEDAAVLQVLELRTHESGTLARLAVLEIDDQIGLAVHLDTHADFDIGGCNLHGVIILWFVCSERKDST